MPDTSDCELVTFSIYYREQYFQRLCDNICQRVNEDMAHGYDGPSPESLNQLREYCSRHSISFKSYAPGEYDQAIHRNLTSLLANWYIEDEILWKMVSKIDIKQFFENEKKYWDNIYPDALKIYQTQQNPELSYIVANKIRFFKEVERQTGINQGDLELMIKNAKIPEEPEPHMPGIWLKETRPGKETSEETAAVMLYAYTLMLKDPENKKEDPLAWWKDICKEAERLGAEIISERNREPDFDMM